MARKLIATNFFPATESDRYVIFINKFDGSGGVLELDPPNPTDLGEVYTFLALTVHAACQFKLTAGSCAKVEVYINAAHAKKETDCTRFHDVQIFNSSHIFGELEEDASKSEFATLFDGHDVRLNMNQGLCNNVCGGQYVERFDCDNILTMTLSCDSGECEVGGGG